MAKRLVLASVILYTFPVLSLGLGFLFAPAIASSSSDLATELQVIRGRHGVPGIWAGYAATATTPTTSAAVGVADIATRTRARPTDLLQFASISKPVTATLTTIALNRAGKDYNTKAVASVPEFAAVALPAYQNITFRDLLTHHTQLQRDMFILPSPLTSPKNYPSARSTAVKDLLQRGTRPLGVNESLYSNAGYVVSTAAMESITGKTYENHFGSILRNELGLSSFGFGRAYTMGSAVKPHWWTPNGWEVAPNDSRDWYQYQTGGAVYGNIADLVRFGQTHLKGLAGGVPTVPTSLWQTMNADQPEGRSATWLYSWMGNNNRFWWHNGRYQGEISEMIVVPTRGWTAAWHFNGSSKTVWNGSAWVENDPWLDERMHRELLELCVDSLLKTNGQRTTQSADLAITGVTTLASDWSTIRQPRASDDGIRIRVTLQFGPSAIKDFKVRAKIGRERGYVYWLDGMNAGNHLFQFFIPNPGAGTHALDVELDDVGLVNDPNRANNRLQGNLTVLP